MLNFIISLTFRFRYILHKIWLWMWSFCSIIFILYFWLIVIDIRIIQSISFFGFIQTLCVKAYIIVIRFIYWLLLIIIVVILKLLINITTKSFIIQRLFWSLFTILSIFRTKFIIIRLFGYFWLLLWLIINTIACRLTFVRVTTKRPESNFFTDNSVRISRNI